jgi:transposase-like protein
MSGFSNMYDHVYRIILARIREKHDVSGAVFFVDGAVHLQTALRRPELRFGYECQGSRNAQNVIENMKKRISSLPNMFSHVEREAAATWVQIFSV